MPCTNCCQSNKGSQNGKIKTYTHLAVISIIVNYAVGTGILNLPHTVAAASVGIAAILIVILTFFGYLNGFFGVDLLGKTYALLRAGQFPGYEVEPFDGEHKIIMENLTSIENLTTTTVTSKSYLTEPNENLTGGENEAVLQTVQNPQTIVEQIDFTIPNHICYHFSNISKLYGGNAGFYIYQIAIILIICGGNWSYANVVSQSLTSIIPFKFLPNFKGGQWNCQDPCQNYAQHCSDAYWIWICVVMVISTILVFFNLAEQKVLQAVITVLRLALLTIVTILIIYCLATQPFLASDQYTSGTFVNPNVKYFYFKLNTFGSLFGSTIFSQIYQHAIPGILQYVRSDTQLKIKHSVAIASICITGLTILIAFPGALYFGNDGANLVTLNFANWSGKDFSATKRGGFVSFLSYLVRLLPPCYVLFGLPLQGIALSSNIQEMIPTSRRTKWAVALVNIVSVVPMVLLAGFFRCLGIIIDFSSIFAYILMAAPSLLCYAATKKCEKRFGKNLKPPFSNCFSHKWLMLTAVVINCIGLVLTIYSLIYGVVVK